MLKKFTYDAKNPVESLCCFEANIGGRAIQFEMGFRFSVSLWLVQNKVHSSKYRLNLERR